MGKKPKILLWDVETSKMIYMGFSLFKPMIQPSSIIQDWFMFCAAWKWYGEDETHTTSLLDFKTRFKKDYTDDGGVIYVLSKVLSEADIIVHHNGDHFDLKKFNARAVKHGIAPVPYIPSVDTLKVAKRHFNFTSNRLDYLAQYLGVGAKVPTTTGLWDRATLGDKDAIEEMVEYNKGDIDPTLEGVYEKLRPYMDRHPNLNLLNGTEHSCPNCGGDNLQRRGTYRTRVSTFQRYQCNDCGSWSRGKSAVDRSDLR